MMSMDETAKKRPFFSSPEELFDDECYDEQLPEKKRRLTPEQVCGNDQLFMFIMLMLALTHVNSSLLFLCDKDPILDSNLTIM